MNGPLKIGLASALALATVSPAFAQYQPPPPQYPSTPQAQPAPQYQSSAQYQQDLDRYQADRAAYEARLQRYEASREGYQAARADYERRRADWEHARTEYDARYGYGSYVRIYGPPPEWDDSRWSNNGRARAAPNYGRESAYSNEDCRRDNSSATAGGIIGALAGAALGSNVAAHGRRTEGAVLGGVVGAIAGAAVGSAHDRYKCDNRGPYYSYEDTIAYREASDFRSGRYDRDYYVRMHCRLAAAPIDGDNQDYRYVRVCPDADGRYRITG